MGEKVSLAWVDFLVGGTIELQLGKIFMVIFTPDLCFLRKL